MLVTGLETLPHEDGTTALHVRVTDAAAVAGLLDFLARTAYTGVRVDEHTVAVAPPPSLHRAVARAEMGIYLGIWGRAHPEVGAEVVGWRRPGLATHR